MGKLNNLIFKKRKNVYFTLKNYKMKCERYLNESAFRTFFVLNSKKCTKQEGGET